MKKILTLAGLLFALAVNAQVGIGTATPREDAILDILSNSQGVLLPNVALTNLTTPLTLSGATPSESLIVYNTATAGAGDLAVTPGYYYWTNDTTGDTGGAAAAAAGKWNRIINKSDLETMLTNISNSNTDLNKIKALLNFAYPSNNLGDTTSGSETSGGGVMYIPSEGKFKYVYFKPGADANTPGTYETKDITNPFGYNITAIPVKTANSYNDSPIFKGIYNAFLKKKSAELSEGFDLVGENTSIVSSAVKVIKITVLDDNLNEITSAVTDVNLSSNVLNFKVGTGNMYNVLYPSDNVAKAIKVLVEFSGTEPTPAP